MYSIRVAILLLSAFLLSAAGPMSSPRIAAVDFIAVVNALNGKVLPAACCKMCSKGKACGNSCISRDKTCHKGVGCACDS